MNDEHTADKIARQTAHTLEKLLPEGFAGAVIVVTPDSKVVLNSNMNPQALAVILAKLTEIAVGNIGAPMVVDPFAVDRKEEIEICEVSGVQVTLRWAKYCDDYDYGWKCKIGDHEYGDHIGYLSLSQKVHVRDLLLEQCAASIAAIKEKEKNGTGTQGTE